MGHSPLDVSQNLIKQILRRHSFWKTLLNSHDEVNFVPFLVKGGQRVDLSLELGGESPCFVPSKENSEVDVAGNSCLHDTAAKNSPSVFTPQAVIAQAVTRSDSGDDSLLPQCRRVTMALACSPLDHLNRVLKLVTTAQKDLDVGVGREHGYYEITAIAKQLLLKMLPLSGIGGVSEESDAIFEDLPSLFLLRRIHCGPFVLVGRPTSARLSVHPWQGQGHRFRWVGS